MKYTYQTEDTCSREITVEVEDGIVKDVSFLGGCNGNLKAISAVVKGMSVEKVNEVFSGITCGGRPTSCSDQMVKAINIAASKEN